MISRYWVSLSIARQPPALLSLGRFEALVEERRGLFSRRDCWRDWKVISSWAR
jgi:hypothetical protein